MSSVLSDAAVTSAGWLRREEERLFGRCALAAQRFRGLLCFRVPIVLAVYLAIAFAIRYRPGEVRSDQQQSQGLPVES